MATQVSQGATGNAYIDGVLSGVKWSGTVTYSFPDSPADYPASYGSGEQFNDFAQLSAQQQTAAHSIMQQIGNYTNLTITFAGTDGADIRMAHSDDANPTAYAYYPDNSSNGEGGDVWFGDNYTNPIVGNYQYATHIHELGHAFGLKHGHELGGPGGVAIPADRDALEFTVMTYRSYIGGPTTGYTNEQFGYPQTFMMNDIAALQTMYGADYTNHSGDNVYSWNSGTGTTFIDGAAMVSPGGNRIFLTIWDGGGIDTYDFSAFSTGVTIDLGPGNYSIGSQAQLANLGNGNFAHGNVYNAYLFQGDARSYIENAIGGSGNDTIVGNAAANVLTGNDGNDSLNGGLGADTMIGGIGNDTYYLDNVGDIVTEGAGLGTDVVNSTITYTLGADVENLVLTAGAGAINGTGNSLVNTITGNESANVLDGMGGADTMIGGLGNDTYYVDTGADIVTEAAGAGTGTDTVNTTASYTLAPNVENLILVAGAGAINGTGNSLANTITGNESDNVLNGGAGGADNIIGGSGIDTVSYASSTSGVTINLDAQATWDGLVTDQLSSIENAIGSSFNDYVWGNSGDNVLDAGAGMDSYVGGSGNDTFVFNRGQGSGDSISDFIGNGVGIGDQFQFVGYGTATQGATFTQVDATHWSINSADGLVYDVITLSNGASIHASDYIFV